VKPSTRTELLPLAVLTALAVAASGLILYAGRDTIFFFDEWDFVLGRRGTSLDTLLEPHVGHLSLVPILIYKALFVTVGLEPYWPYRLVVLLLHLTCVGLLYSIARRRLGAWAAVAVASLLLFLGAAWEVLLWPFEISYLGSLAGGLGAWLALQEEGRGRNVAAAGLITVALASSGVGVPLALGILAGLLLVADRRRRAWVVAPGLALYAVWLVAYGLSDNSAESPELSNLPELPGYAAGMAASAAGGITGLGEDWGRIAVVALAVVVVLRVARKGVSPWLGAALVSVGLFWALTALSRADVAPASSSRYIYPSVVFLLLAAVELAPDWNAWRHRVSGRPLVWALVAGAVAWSALGNSDSLRDGARALRSATDAVEPALAALEVSDGAAAADERPAPQYAPQVSAGPYLAAVRDFGSPLPDGLGAELGAAGGAVDSALLGAERVAGTPAPADTATGQAPAVVQAIMGATRIAGGCVVFRPEGVPAALDVRVAPGATLLVENRGAAPAELRLRRFGGDFPAQALAQLPARERLAIALPRDASPTPWVARLSPSDAVAACLAG
jgi:hypothetical protein